MSKRVSFKDTIYKHIENNSKEYIFITLIFLVGIFLGVMFINNGTESHLSEINSYLNNFVNKLKNTEDLKCFEMLKITISENIILAITLWFFRNYCNWNSCSFWNHFV